MCVNNDGCKHQQTNGQFLAFYEEPEVSIRFFKKNWNGFVDTKIGNPGFDFAMVFEKKKIRLQFWFQKLDSILILSNLV
jgi:hypothetical protein